MEMVAIWLGISSNLFVIIGGLIAAAKLAYAKKVRDDKVDELVKQLNPSNGPCIMERMDTVEATLAKQDKVLSNQTEKLNELLAA